MDRLKRMAIIVTGGRDYSDRTRVYDALDTYLNAFEAIRIVHGGARGADSIAGQWAEERQMPVRVFPADWSLARECRGHTHTLKGAGHCRNGRMLRETIAEAGDPDLVVVVAFPGGRGTADCVSQAVSLGLAVRSVE